MSLQRPRRIFHAYQPRRRLPRPGRAVSLAALGLVAGGVVAMAAIRTSLFAPAHTATPALLAAPARQVAVIDGETLRLADTVIRLRGLTAPARGEPCPAEVPSHDCGAAAAGTLVRLIGDSLVQCRLHGRDGQGRPLASCTAGGVALNQAIVAAGWARARADTGPLAQAEAAARARGLGLWGGAAASR